MAINESKRNPGVSKEEIKKWLGSIGCGKIDISQLMTGLSFVQLIGEPELSVKLIAIMEMIDGFITKAIVIDIIHNEDIVEHEHHYKMGKMPSQITSEDLYFVPPRVGVEFLNMAAYYSKSEDYAWG